MIGSWIRTAGLVALAGGFYAVSAPIGALAARAVGVGCRARGLSLNCALAPDGALDPATYGVSAAALAAAWWCSAVLLRHRPVQPFVGLFAALGLGAIVYDALVGRPLVTGERLINDTFDVLRFLMFASFALLLLIARRWTVSWRGVGLAAATSFAAATVSMIAFYWVRPGLIGAFELYVLYVAYAFGGFTLHLMTLSRLVAGARPGLGAGGDLGDLTGGDRHDLTGGQTRQLRLAGGSGHDGWARQASTHHAVHLRSGGVHRREPARVAIGIAAAGVDHLAEGDLAQAVAFGGGDKIGPGSGAGAEQDGQASQGN